MSVKLLDLGHAFPGQPFLFRHLDVTVRSNAVTAVVGPSGSGKSTLLGIVAEWVKPREGRVERAQASTLSWVFQNPIGVANRTAIDHVCLPLVGRGMSRVQAEAQAEELLAQFGLSHRRGIPFKALSGGEGQRLMLSRAVAVAADIILVDEPTAQLDPRSAETVIEVLAALAGEGRHVMIATHDHRVRDACHEVVDLASFQDMSVGSR